MGFEKKLDRGESARVYWSVLCFCFSDSDKTKDETRACTPLVVSVKCRDSSWAVEVKSEIILHGFCSVEFF